MLDTADTLPRPRYLHAEGDIAVWHALEAAIGEVRERRNRRGPRKVGRIR